MRKLRILCLHGLAQNGIHFRKKMTTLATSIDKQAELVYVTAPHVILSPEYSSVSKREQDSNITISDEVKAFGWWHPLRYKKLLPDGTCVGTMETLSFLKQVMIDQGPFDGILGFSQGACLSACLSVMLENRTILPNMIPPDFPHPSLKFVIIVAGFPPKQQEAFKPLFAQPIKIRTPSMHMIGDLDTLVLPEQMNELANLYQDPVIFKHSGGHFVPSSIAAQKNLSEFLSRFIQ
ncbi:serine hydrolase FSH [Halteromyces radiatus]|uniref:serine hydrolase FSH n=1 Tax=Halteromyces radiatus TaxID=101107 RepID=UPI00221FF855|nr:serine hydrolase FSH [Halteromyces radiatus]KAI8092671.1 serine hydrolase FSH [Halteromyces radiatus]